MTGRLAGKTAVITGAASGMGAETARVFAREGANVVVADMQEELGESVAAELGGRGVFVRVDVTREADVEAMVAEAVRRWGSLDVLFNNAGFGGAMGPIESIAIEDYDLTMDVLLRGPFLGMKHAAPVMKEQGSGSIISTSSGAGYVVGETPHLYSTAKAAVIHLTKSVAMELGHWGIRVNAIAPGVITTPLAAGRPGASEETYEKMRQRMGKHQPIGRIGEPSDIANAALFLASDESTFITAECIRVDGGTVVGRAWSRQPKLNTEPRPLRLYRPVGR